MKRFTIIMLVLLAVLPVASFALDVVINPYTTDNIGNMLATGYTPTFQTKYTGVYVNTTFDMKDAGKLTAGLDTFLFLTAATTVSYDTYLDPTVTYAISIFTAKLDLPFDILSSATNANAFPSFWVTPGVKLAIDKTSSVGATMKTTIYTDFSKFDIQPKVTYANGAFAAYAQLKMPNIGTATTGQALTLTPGATYKIGDLTFEAFVDFGNLNAPGKSLSMTPWLKLSYAPKVTF